MSRMMLGNCYFHMQCYYTVQHSLVQKQQRKIRMSEKRKLVKMKNMSCNCMSKMKQFQNTRDRNKHIKFVQKKK